VGEVAPALILLHGFTQTRQSWRLTIRELAGRYRALAPDLPGHGSAAQRTASFAACTAYIRALAPATPFTLAGYSMGGRIALHAALQLENVNRLILIGASPGIADPAERAERARADEALAERLLTIGIDAFAREWGSQPLFAGQPERVAALRGLGTGVMEPLWDRLGELRIPVTLIVGERDAKFRAIAERMLELLPDGRLEIIAGAGHAAQLEAPAAIAEAIYQSGSPSSSASA
jgi:2-succinyl-6-hydroxy-2,4-cyclohexadiene-1-carboxylate synthase